MDLRLLRLLFAAITDINDGELRENLQLYIKDGLQILCNMLLIVSMNLYTFTEFFIIISITFVIIILCKS